MKGPIPLIFGILLSLPAAAFTLDFSSDVGASIPPDLTVNVFGYGDVEFSAGFGSVLEVGNKFQNDDGSAAASLQMVGGDTVNITFLGTQPLNVDFDFVGVGVGEVFQTFQTGPQSYFVALQSSANGAGIASVSFNVVPEPSTALLSLVGAFALALRRRR